MRERLTYWVDSFLALMVCGVIRIIWDKDAALRWYDVLKPQPPTLGTERERA